jgi:hypothetical protein
MRRSLPLRWSRRTTDGLKALPRPQCRWHWATVASASSGPTFRRRPGTGRATLSPGSYHPVIGDGKTTPAQWISHPFLIRRYSYRPRKGVRDLFYSFRERKRSLIPFLVETSTDTGFYPRQFLSEVRATPHRSPAPPLPAGRFLRPPRCRNRPAGCSPSRSPCRSLYRGPSPNLMR